MTDWSKINRRLNEKLRNAKEERLQLLQNRINNKGIKDVFLTEYALVLHLENNENIQFEITTGFKEGKLTKVKGFDEED